MIGVELVLAALATGAVAGATEAASSAVVDAYGKLKATLSRLFGDDKKAESAVELFEGDPEGLTPTLTKVLTDHGAADDPEVMLAAQRVLDAAGPQATGHGSVAANVLQIHADRGGVAGATF